MCKINIKNLDSMNIVLSRINSGEEITITDLDFSPLLDVKVKIYGNSYKGKLNSNIIVALNNYHAELQKVFCMVKYNNSDLRSLSPEDKKLLVIEYQVQEGCTEIIKSLTNFINSIGDAFEKMTHGMTGNQKTACMISLILCLSGGWGVSETFDYLKYKDDNQKQVAMTDKEIEKLKETQDGILNAVKAGISAVTNGNSRSEQIILQSNEQIKKAYSSTLKLLPSVDSVDVSSGNFNVNLNNKEIEEIISTTKGKLETIEATKTIFIETVKKSIDKLTITCSEINSDYSFTLSVDRSFIDDDEVSIIFDNFKLDKPIKVFGAFKTRNGIIEKANASKIENL